MLNSRKKAASNARGKPARGAGARKKKVKKKFDGPSLATWRYGLAKLGIMALGVVLIGRIAALQVLPDLEQGYEFLQYEGDRRTIRDQKIPAYRGSIVDRNGKPLAVSTPLVDITADPKFLDEAELPKLAAALGMSENELAQKYAAYKSKRFMSLKRGLRPDVAQTIVNMGFSGVHDDLSFRRYYPAGEVTAQTLGLMHSEGHGIEGLELGYDDWLSGIAGEQRVVIDRKQKVVDYLGVLSPVEPGQDLQLTIDLELQYLAYKALKAAFVEHQAASASMVLMDPRTGEILAMASQPSFNPNNRENINYQAVRNRALVDSFEPGSTVKPFTMLAALESGDYQPTTPVDTSPGYVRVDGNIIRDFRNYQLLDLTSVLAKSSQVGTVKIALSLDEDHLFDTFQSVGLGEPAGLGFPGEVGGSLPQRYDWDDIQRATFAFGYGITATTLQLAQAYSVIANDGQMVLPTLVKGANVPPPIRVASSESVSEIIEMMREVVEHGTGTRAAIEGYSVAGKTGTGHLVGAGGYEDHRYSSLFAGMAPAENPELVAVVVITDPKGEDYFGGLVAAPIFADVVGNALRILNVPGDQPGLLVGYSQ